MSSFAQVITILCALLPAWVVAAALAIISLALIIIAIKVVSFVLDAIPFL